MIKTSSTITGSFILILLATSYAYANVPIGASVIINFPLIVYFSSYGLGLIAIILIESLILKKELQLRSALTSILLAGKINLFSFAIGLLIAISFSSGSILLASFLPGVFLFTFFSLKISKETQIFSKIPKPKLTFSVFYIAIGILTLYLCSVLMPYTFLKHGILNTEIITELPSVVVTVLSMFSLLFIGFIATCISEGYYLSRYTQRKDKIISSIIKMNAISYLALIGTTGYINFQKFITGL